MPELRYIIHTQFYYFNFSDQQSGRHGAPLDQQNNYMMTVEYKKEKDLETLKDDISAHISHS